MEAGHIRERGTEWDAVRALLAHEAQTAMGRERAAAAEPLTDKITWQSGNRYTFRLRASTYMQTAMLIPEAARLKKPGIV